jgi:hypothetical protein
MRALSSTLSSNRITAQIHSDKRTLVDLVQPDSVIRLVAVAVYVNRHVAHSKSLEQKSTKMVRVEL